MAIYVAFPTLSLWSYRATFERRLCRCSDDDSLVRDEEGHLYGARTRTRRGKHSWMAAYQ